MKHGSHQHLDDARFRGVYLMLASLLPIAQATHLKETFVDRAADTKDHDLSDAVVQILKARRTEHNVAASSVARTG